MMPLRNPPLRRMAYSKKQPAALAKSCTTQLAAPAKSAAAKRAKSAEQQREGVSAYELQRLDNMARNQKMLEELGLVGPGSALRR